MSYIVTRYPAGTFSWADFFSTDVAKSKDFLKSLFGWTSEDMPTGEGRPDYTMFSLEGKYIAGGSQAFAPGMPSFWSSYISVDNVDEIAAKAEKLGAKIMMPPMDVLDSGRMASIIDPTGATVSLWQPKSHIGASVVNKAGAMSWNELYTTDVEKAKTFFAELLGWTYETDDKSRYTTILNNGRMNGGIFALTPEMAEMPPCWVVYFTVENLEQAVEKVTDLGGKIYMPPKIISAGKIAMVADPTGASFMLIEMNETPTEWIEK